MDTINLIDFLININTSILIIYILTCMGLFYSKEIREIILNECNRDSLIGKYMYMRHKWISPFIVRIVSVILFLSLMAIFIIYLFSDIHTELSLFYVILFTSISIMIQSTLIFYIIKTINKIRLGKLEIIPTELRITLGSTSNDMFKLYLGISIVLHISVLIKVILK